MSEVIIFTMVPSNNLDVTLLSVYNASHGGEYDLAGEIQYREALSQEGWITYSECRKDPQSRHKASSCRVILTRMTDSGITYGKELVKNKEEDAVDFLNHLESFPPRIGTLYRYLVKKWLKSIPNREKYGWEIKRSSTVSPKLELPLPYIVKETISNLNTLLVERGLSSYASLSHKTSGPSEPTLVTCPTIEQVLYYGRGWKAPYATGTQYAELDEYLRFLFDGLCLAQAKDHLFFTVRANRNRIDEGTIEWIHREYGAPRDTLVRFLKELEDSDTIHIMDDETRQKECVYAKVSRPYYFRDLTDDIKRIEDELKETVQRWFETGEEKFQRFNFRLNRI